MTPTNPDNPFTPFLPTTFTVPKEELNFNAFINDNFSKISDVVNDKKIGAYTESTTSQNGNKVIYDDPKVTRNGSQYLARVVSYPASGTLTLDAPPDINEQWVIFQVWGSASKPPTSLGAGDGDFFSFFGSGTPKITFSMSDLNIVITTTGLGAGYSGFIVIDFIPNGI
jgi:hypothetical protein